MAEELPPNLRSEEKKIAALRLDPQPAERRRPGAPDRASSHELQVKSERLPVPVDVSRPEPAVAQAWIRDSKTRVLLGIIALLAVLLLVVLVMIGVAPSGNGKTAKSTADASTDRTTAPAARGTISPSSDATTQAPASPAATGSSGPGAAGLTSPVTTVYQGVTVTFPPLTGFAAAELSLAPPHPQVALGSYGDPTTDLMYNPGTWESSDPIADLGTGEPSYGTCMTLVQLHPMNLSDQSLIQGHGYCLQVSTNPSMIAYVKVISAPDGYVYNSPTISLSVTLWQSQG